MAQGEIHPGVAAQHAGREVLKSHSVSQNRVCVGCMGFIRLPGQALDECHPQRVAGRPMGSAAVGGRQQIPEVGKFITINSPSACLKQRCISPLLQQVRPSLQGLRHSSYLTPLHGPLMN